MNNMKEKQVTYDGYCNTQEREYFNLDMPEFTRQPAANAQTQSRSKNYGGDGSVQTPQYYYAPAQPSAYDQQTVTMPQQQPQYQGYAAPAQAAPQFRPAGEATPAPRAEVHSYPVAAPNHSGQVQYGAQAAPSRGMMGYDAYAGKGYAMPAQTNAGQGTFHQYRQTSTQKTGKKLNAKAKLVITVYFMIIAVIATLLLVNIALDGKKTVVAGQDDRPYIGSAQLGTATDANGNKIHMDKLEGTVDYQIGASSGKFDGFCDWIANLFG